MSAVLVVTKNKKQVARVNVTGDRFSIGRGNQCDYPVDEELASRKHAEILSEGTEFWVQDLQSTNGTLLNGQKITGRTALKDGDEIGIGSTRLRFFSDLARGAAQGDDDLTRPAGARAASNEAVAQPVVEEKDLGPIRVKVRISGGPLDGGKFKNWAGPLTIGRSLENRVVLLDNAVSTRHAQITKEGEDYFVEDLESANGTFLDGVKVRRQQLAHGQKIKVGASTLLFERVDLRLRRRYTKLIGLGLAGVVVMIILLKLVQPPDVAGQHIEQARAYADQGELEKAYDAYQAALKVEPSRAEATQEGNKVKAALEARRMLRMAETAAEQEKYDKAKELVYSVLRENPKHARALELETVVKSIEDAAVAMRGRNWSAAVALLEKAREKSPKSQLITSRLDAAQKEQTAEHSLASAKEAIQHRQGDLAEGYLKTIPSGSVYFTEARELLDGIVRDRKTAEWVQKAEADYRAARLAEALVDIDEALKTDSNNAALLGLRTRARRMDELKSSLVQAESLKRSDNLDALVAGRAACEAVLKLESDSLNELRKRAQETKDALEQQLRTLSQTYTKRAQALPLPAEVKEALRLYSMAARADPTNETAAGAARKLRADVQRECRKLFGEGLRFEELQQKALAQERFRKVVELAPIDDEYYKKASAKLQ